MPNQFKPVVLAQLGDLPPASRAERDAIYDRLRGELAAMAGHEAEPGEHAELARALEQAIEAVEAELQGVGQAAPPTPPAAALKILAKPNRARAAALLAAVAIAVAMAGGGAWYFVATQVESPPRPGLVVPQQDADAAVKQNLDQAATDKARSFQEALRNGDAETAAFLLQSGYVPTRVELRAALLDVKYTAQIQAATLSLAADIRELACGFTTFSNVRRPMIAPRLYDAEDAFAIMKQLGQQAWKSTCAVDAGKWRAALARIEQQYAQYGKPDAEKKQQAEACIARFGTSEAQQRWEQANCAACPEGHSNCEAWCPNAAKAADGEEARFFSFNRADMLLAATMSRRPNPNRAELYCNLQYLTRATDFDLANLQRFKSLVGLFE